VNPTLLLQLLVAYGPAVLPLIQQIVSWIEAGKTTVSTADMAQLVALGQKKASDYLTPV
jgi:hypothetical protein